MDCPRCKRIRSIQAPKDRHPLGVEIVLHRTIEELRNGLAASCWWCGNISSFLLDWAGPALHEIHSLESRIARKKDHYNIHVFYTYDQNKFQETMGIMNYHKMPPAVKLERRTDSSQSWQYIQRRLRECEDLHKETCGSSEIEKKLPTWLIEIEEQQDSARKCRLVKSCSGALIENYVTMSHRWQPGLMDQKKLCTSNLQDYQNYIPMEGLPKHYADAIEVTWKLGFRHLWIDFLCIVQDSEELGHEIGRMTQIYQNAYCNLSAASADQGTEGLFFDRDYIRLPHPFISKAHESWCVASFHSACLFGGLDSQPLYRRGWVCQERLLARRNISFTKNLIFIECHSSMDCELGPAICHDGSSFNSVGARFASGGKEYAALRKLERCDLLPFWTATIQFYSQSKLTYADDRLTAISGLARYIANATKVEYLAGLWNSRLAYQLVWYKIHVTTHPRQRMPSDRAPSWSWANIDGPVSFPSTNFTGILPVVEILEAKCERPYESKSTGHIRLHGWVIPFRNQKNVKMRSPETHLRNCISVNIGLTSRLQIFWDMTIAKEFNKAQIVVGSLTKDCYALPLFIDHQDLHGIVVTSTSTKEFRRLGKWCIGLMRDPNGESPEGPIASHSNATEISRQAPEAATSTTEDEENFIRDAPYTVRALLDLFGECDLPFLETVSGGRKLITLV